MAHREQGLTCVGRSSARSSNPSPSLATIALPMSAPSVRGATLWMFGCVEICSALAGAGKVGSAAGRRDLIYRDSHNSRDVRRPPTRALLLPRRLPASQPPVPLSRPLPHCLHRAPGDLGCPGAASAAGGRTPGALAQLGFPGAGCVHRRGRLPHGTRGEHTNHTRRPAQVSFVSPALPSYPPTRKVEAAGAAQTAGSSGLGFLKCPLQGGTGQAWQVPGLWPAGLARRETRRRPPSLACCTVGTPGPSRPSLGCLLCV